LPRRIAKHPIQIKKNCSAGKVNHPYCLYHSPSTLMCIHPPDPPMWRKPLGPLMWRQPPRLSKRRRSRAPAPQMLPKTSVRTLELHSTSGP
jgi:hypothetical protein